MNELHSRKILYREVLNSRSVNIASTIDWQKEAEELCSLPVCILIVGDSEDCSATSSEEASVLMSSQEKVSQATSETVQWGTISAVRDLPEAEDDLGWNLSQEVIGGDTTDETTNSLR